MFVWGQGMISAAEQSSQVQLLSPEVCRHTRHRSTSWKMELQMQRAASAMPPHDANSQTTHGCCSLLVEQGDGSRSVHVCAHEKEGRVSERRPVMQQVTVSVLQNKIRSRRPSFLISLWSSSSLFSAPSAVIGVGGCLGIIFMLITVTSGELLLRMFQCRNSFSLRVYIMS